MEELSCSRPRSRSRSHSSSRSRPRSPVAGNQQLWGKSSTTEEAHSDSTEELDGKQRSTKRMKETHTVGGPLPPETTIKTTGLPGVNQPSYRDKLAGTIPGAFVEAFHIDRLGDDDSDDDMPPENEDGSLRIYLTREEKARIRAPWRDALIVKPFGKPLEYNYLANKLQSLWSPRGRMECQMWDLGFLL